MSHQQRLFIYRNNNPILVRKYMNNINWEENNESKDLSKADSLTSQQLQAMQLVARMKEAADRCGSGFVGGFITPTGERFMMSNMEEDDVQKQAIEQQLNQIQKERMDMLKINEQIQKMLEDFEG